MFICSHHRDRLIVSRTVSLTSVSLSERVLLVLDFSAGCMENLAGLHTLACKLFLVIEAPHAAASNNKAAKRRYYFG